MFKVTETLILNANTVNTKQLFGPEKLPGLSRNGPLKLVSRKFFSKEFRVLKVTGTLEKRDPRDRFSKVPVTFRARNKVFKSKYKE